MAEVEGCIVPALCPVGHQVDGDDASTALAAALERSPLYLPNSNCTFELSETAKIKEVCASDWL